MQCLKRVSVTHSSVVELCDCAYAELWGSNIDNITQHVAAHKRESCVQPTPPSATKLTCKNQKSMVVVVCVIEKESRNHHMDFTTTT